MHRAPGAREGAEGLRALALAVSLAALAACQRRAPELRGELAGAWLRDPERASGFELRTDGTLALLGQPALSGLAWNAAHGELVLSLNDADHVESHVVRLALAKLDGDALQLEGDDARFAGAYRRARAEHVRGVLTYRERVALPPDAHVLVELSRAGALPVALAVFVPHGQVPIGFELSVPAPAEASYSLVARIGDRERTWFATPEPVSMAPGDEAAEVLLRPAR
ncbi:MAG TPA: YbaY family lipoprotein [Myxococcota bacterium]|nr:YbaY family lipoprotein [Myxococcota bacterium]